MNITSILFYLLCIIYLLLVVFFPSYDHVSMEEGFDYDDVTLPSFLGSIGKSVNSKFSKASSKMSAISGSSGTSNTSKVSSLPSNASVGDYSTGVTSVMTRRASNESGNRRQNAPLPSIEEIREQ